MTFLLDVSVLIALVDRDHVAHEVAQVWFEQTGHSAWASCPITENGLLRILGHPRYPNSPGSPAAVAGILASMRSLPGHHFWSDDFSLVGKDHIDSGRILTSAQVTDTYLLALAISKGGRLATLDRRLSTSAVRGGSAALHVIG